MNIERTLKCKWEKSFHGRYEQWLLLLRGSGWSVLQSPYTSKLFTSTCYFYNRDNQPKCT